MFDIFRQGGSKFASRQRVALDRVTQDLAEAEARIAPLEQRLGEASLAGEDTGAIEAELATARRLVDTKRHAVRAAEIAEEKRLAAKLADDEAKRLAAEARENAAKCKLFRHHVAEMARFATDYEDAVFRESIAYMKLCREAAAARALLPEPPTAMLNSATGPAREIMVGQDDLSLIHQDLHPNKLDDMCRDELMRVGPELPRTRFGGTPAEISLTKHIAALFDGCADALAAHLDVDLNAATKNAGQFRRAEPVPEPAPEHTLKPSQDALQAPEGVEEHTIAPDATLPPSELEAPSNDAPEPATEEITDPAIEPPSEYVEPSPEVVAEHLAWQAKRDAAEAEVEAKAKLLIRDGLRRLAGSGGKGAPVLDEAAKNPPTPEILP